MFTPTRLRRSAILGALACALLSAPAGAADQPCRVSLGAGLPSVPCAEVAVASNAAHAQEDYYSSYGVPEPITAPIAPAPTDDTPWLVIAFGATAALAAASVAMIHRRRLRLRRRVARAAV
jgi:hypothetical protein